MLHLPGNPDSEPTTAPARRHGSGAGEVGGELLSAAVDLPWDDWLGVGAGDRVRDGSLGLVRHAWPATAAQDMGAASTDGGMLQGDAADRERLGALAVAVAGAHDRPARMPHAPGQEPYAWWLPAERTLVWMPWRDETDPPYGLALLDSGEADAVTVAAPDAVWTVFRTGLPRTGSRGDLTSLPERFRAALEARADVADPGVATTVRWRRDGDTVTVRWRAAERVRTLSVVINTLDGTRSAALDPRR